MSCVFTAPLQITEWIYDLSLIDPASFEAVIVEKKTSGCVYFFRTGEMDIDIDKLPENCTTCFPNAVKFTQAGGFGCRLESSGLIRSR
jgi:hypothetical protein